MGQKLIIDKDTLTEIGDAVREKSGTSNLIKVSDLAQAVADLPSGGATEPYREDVYSDTNHQRLTSAKLHGYKSIPPCMFYFQSLTGKAAAELTSVDCSDSNITEIGHHAFYGQKALENFEIPQTVAVIGDYAFSYTKIPSVVIPEAVTKLEAQAFAYCGSLTSISLPETLTYIGNSAFAQCTNLVLTTLPHGLKNLLDNVFLKCTSLNSITFNSKPTIRTTAFSQCTNLTTINVPWSEGEVAGAPWGATNATINYNYTGE